MAILHHCAKFCGDYLSHQSFAEIPHFSNLFEMVAVHYFGFVWHKFGPPNE